ncbi:protein FAR1-RELATED SEQUENCE 5-like [Vicia villosa]|uniref:protein FAR1-RELATED SEQUENCE 5-like n=1 Tax=Vicia villosa TaxID=3911 RepID=UPI00273AE486|nr:protein FAR1-RELATED SEQUENCE 5-like [Vicia villosa]
MEETILDDELESNINFSEEPQINIVAEENIEPYVGMEFDSLEKATDFYRLFSKAKGFGIRTRSSKANYCILVCVREGKLPVKSTNDNNVEVKKKCSTMRMGCQASLTISKENNSHMWTVKSYDNNHNHVMASPKSVSYLRCHKNMNSAAKNLIEKFSEEGLPTGKVASMFKESDLAFSNRDCWNHMRNVRTNNLDIGDAQAVFNYCKHKQAQNSNFFYAIQCDDEARMVKKNWVDARSSLAYQHFGDVVTFDTTYKTNKYSMLFAPFTGVNHHLQSILFGCALLQDESEISFTWLFDTWLEAMNGKKPISIITDQDLAIGAAVTKVFPQTRHRLCLWHIRKKFPEKLAHIYHKKSKFKHELKRCIRESPTVNDFEVDWQQIMDTYNLQENEWLQRLFEIRESWIPVYNRKTFFAGMNTTQRSESINSFFDSFVNSTTTLQEFVVKFEMAVNNRYEAEKREDFESKHKSRILSIKSKIEGHATSIYTRNMFGKFQHELALVSQFTKHKFEKNGSQYRYQISNCFKDRDKFIVDINLDSKDATCTCQLFEFMGILCRHILTIFQTKNILQIPSQYILHSWTKEGNRCMEVSVMDSYNDEVDTLRSIHLNQQFSKFSKFSKQSKEAYEFIMVEFERICNTLETMGLKFSNVNDAPIDLQQQDVDDTHDNVSNFIIQDPNVSQKKGRKRKDSDNVCVQERYKRGVELSMDKTLVKRRACKYCGEYGHYQSTCKNKTT